MDTRHTLVRTASATPTIDTSAYAAGDLVGTKMEFDFSAFKLADGHLILDRVLISDLADQGADLDLVLFDADLATDISSMDNAAFDPDDADVAKIVAVIPVTNHKSFNDNGISYANEVNVPLNLPITAASLTLYGVLVSRGTPTYATDSDLTVKVTARTP